MLCLIPIEMTWGKTGITQLSMFTEKRQMIVAAHTLRSIYLFGIALFAGTFASKEHRITAARDI